jgi:plasmid stabilization system protein ParE
VHPYLGISHGSVQRRLRLDTGYYVIYRVDPQRRLIRIANVLHESELYG